MRIFAAGMVTETNTFCPIPTTLEDFIIQRGRPEGRVPARYSGFDLDRIWGRLAEARGDEFVLSLMALAQPAGLTAKGAYEAMRDEILADLRAAMPVDIVLLMLHGAMIADRYDDCEEDVVRRVREVVGKETVIAAELDLHCHLSESMLGPTDIVMTYKEYPHTDINDRARQLFALAVAARLQEIRPTQALFDCRMIGMYPTTRDPMRGFVDAMSEMERRPGVLSVSFGHGFQFADVPHMGAKLLVVTDNDLAAATRIARELGMQVHGLRRDIGFESISTPLDTALIRAMAADKVPVVVADQSDNPGGGAPSDATFALRWLLEHHARDAALAILYDPEVVAIARKAGVGARLPVRLGGKMGPLSGSPIDLDVEIVSIADEYVHSFPQASGEAVTFPVGNVVALRSGSVDIVVGTERCQCYGPSIFVDLGIDPTRKRVLVVKSTQHFRRAFEAIASEIIYMAGPGALAPDPRQLTYKRFDNRRVYPWESAPFEGQQ
jgi:microcystin degradation protein MlrC